jgi:hypothetical protein
MNRIKQAEQFCLSEKKGIYIPKNCYERVANFIVKSLECKVDKKIHFNELLDMAIRELNQEFNGNTAWYLMHVKNDMALRGLINLNFTVYREQVIEKKNQRKTKRQIRHHLH